MFNLRIAAASMVTFILLLGVMSYVTDKGYDKVKPKIEEQKQKALQQQREFGKYIQQDLQGMGAPPSAYNGADIPPGSGEFPEMGTSVRQLRPIGTWMGLRQGDGGKMAVMKFDKKNYWLVIKNPGAGETTEKGKYEYQFDRILFKPATGQEYSLEYYMISNKAIQLTNYQLSYALEKADNLKIDF